jgi:hypothetical protein
VYIRDKKYRLAKIPTNALQIVIDLGNATNGSVAVGDRVCIICGQHPLGALAKVCILGWLHAAAKGTSEAHKHDVRQCTMQSVELQHWPTRRSSAMPS